MNDQAGPSRVIWLASYPRSGALWLRALIGNLLVGDLQSSAQLQQVIPEIDATTGRRVALPPGRRTLIATRWPRKADTFASGTTDGYICIVRNPLDVMRSLFQFNRMEYVPANRPPDEETLEKAWQAYAERFTASAGHPLRDAGADHLNWVNHVASWRRAEGVPALYVRYEDLLADTAGQLKRMCRFLRAPLDDAAADRIVRKSRRDILQALEIHELKSRKKGLFYRPELEAALLRGARVISPADRPARDLPETVRADFMAAFSPTMTDLGYTLAPDAQTVAVSPEPLGEETVLPEGPDFAAARVGRIFKPTKVPTDLVEERS